MPSKRQIHAQLKQFGANLRRERLRSELTQMELAEMTDLNVRTVQKIEAGQTNVLITTAARLQKAMGCAWERLMG